MKKVLFLLMALIVCSLSAWSKTPSPAVVGISVSQSNYGYTYTNTMGMSIEPFQELYENGKYAVGERINEQGWFEATFFQWGQGVKFK